MTINSRNKGAIGEREFAQFLTERGFDARRGQQFSGSSESPDVVCKSLAFIHPEVKRVEKGSPYVWLAQATRDARPEQIPVVFWRKNREEWTSFLNAEHFLQLLRMI